MGTKIELTAGSDNAIYIAKDDFHGSWKILRTKVQGSEASVMFIVKSEEQAYAAGQGIANAIGGKFYDKFDPRILNP